MHVGYKLSMRAMHTQACCLQAEETIFGRVSVYLSLHDCLRGLGTVLKQLTGISMERVPMLPGVNMVKCMHWCIFFVALKLGKLLPACQSALLQLLLSLFSL